MHLLQLGLQRGLTFPVNFLETFPKVSKNFPKILKCFCYNGHQQKQDVFVGVCVWQGEYLLGGN